VVPIFFDGDPFQSDVERFLSELPRSAYWRATTGEYGVGRLSVESSIVVHDGTPATGEHADIEPWLAAHLDGADPAWPAASPDDINVVFYPQTLADMGTGDLSCTGFSYHSESRGGSVDAGREPSFVFAVVAECPESAGELGLDGVTEGLSHELIEASTDPFWTTNPAYNWLRLDELAWSILIDPTEGGGGYAEVADLCTWEAGPHVAARLVDDFSVERSWSNAAASQNQDPCVPVLDETYFGAAPDLTETVTMKTSKQREYRTNGLSVPLHQSRTVDVRLFSTKARSDFHVSAEEILQNQGDEPTLKFAWDRQTGNDHDFLHLTITRIGDGPIGGSQIRIRAGELHDTTFKHGWMGFIAN